MTRSDSRLQRMIGRLADMNSNDRAYVLHRLGPELRERLVPLLAEVAPSDAMSPGLQALLRSVARGKQPTSMTPKAFALLRTLNPAPIGLAPASRDAGDGLAGRVSALIRQVVG